MAKVARDIPHGEVCLNCHIPPEHTLADLQRKDPNFSSRFSTGTLYVSGETGLSRHDLHYNGVGVSQPFPLPRSYSLTPEQLGAVFTGGLNGALALVEETPEEVSPDSSFDKKWHDAVDRFKSAVSSGDEARQQSIFAEIIDIGVERYHLQRFPNQIAQSNLKYEQIGTLRAIAIDSNNRLYSTLACHGNGRVYDPGWESANAAAASEDIAYRQALSMQQKVVTERERLWKRGLGVFESELHTVLSNATLVVGTESSPEATLTPSAAMVFAETFSRLSDFERARKYFNLASASPLQSSAGSVWSRLSVLELDIDGSDKSRIKEAADELEKIREALPGLLMRAIDGEAFAADEPKDSEINIGAEPAGGPGSPDAVYKVWARTWGLLYDAYSLMDDDHEAQLYKLEQSRRSMLESRRGKADAFEARLHVLNFDRVVTRATMNGGYIGLALRLDGSEAAKKLFDELGVALGSLRTFVQPFLKNDKGDPFFEHLAELSWKVFFDGFRGRDLPKDGLTHLAERVLIPSSMGGFSETLYVETQLMRLKGESPWLFLPDGKLNPAVDVSETPEGRDAASRTLSAYYVSQSMLREAGLPIGAAAACFAIGGGFTAETLVGPMIAAGVCSLGGSFVNLGVNVYNASDQYRQSRSTGLSQVTAEEFNANRLKWVLSTAGNTTFNAVGIGPAAGLFAKVGVVAVSKAVSAGVFLSLGQVLKPAAISQGVRELSGAVGGSFWKLPLVSRWQLAGGAGAVAADYFFIDRNGNIAPLDGKIDHWIGNLGEAAMAGAAGYKAAQTTWNRALASAISQNAIRRGVVLAGSDLIAADYFLVKKNRTTGELELVDSAPPAVSSWKSDHVYDSQFSIDSSMGKLGAMMVLGDWTFNELIHAGKWQKIRWGTWGGLVAADFGLFSNGFQWEPGDGEFNSVVGGVGGSLLVSEAGYRMLGVNPAGSMVGVPFRIAYEWLMQYQQQVPLAAPDPTRMVSAAVESVFMIMVVQGTYQGEHFFNQFPVGRNLVQFASGIPGLRSIPCVQNIGSLNFFGGEPPAIAGWSKGKEVSPDVVREVSYGKAPGVTTEGTYLLRRDKRWNEANLNGHSSDEPLKLTVIGNGGPKAFTFDGRVVDEDFLAKQGYLWSEGKLYQFAPLRRAVVNIGSRRATVEDLNRLDETARAETIQQLESHGWRIVDDHFERKWIENPYHPEVLTKKPTQQFNPDEYKVVPSVIERKSPDGRTEKVQVWLKFTRKVTKTSEVSVGGGDFLLWKGTREKPVFGVVGIVFAAPITSGEAYATNNYIFRKTSSGDPSYQPLQRLFNYSFTSMVTWPLIQAPLGMADPKGQLAGRAVGFIPNLIGNAFFPVYRNTVPGQVSFYNALDSGDADTALNVYRNILTSLSFSASGTWDEVETPALYNIRHGIDCRMELAMDGKADGECEMLPSATQSQIRQMEKMDSRKTTPEKMMRRFSVWAEFYHDRMSSRSEIDEIDRRLLVIMTAHFKEIINRYKDDRRMDGALQPLRALARTHPFMFQNPDIPLLTTENEWVRFVNDVNRNHLQILQRLRYLNAPSESATVNQSL